MSGTNFSRQFHSFPGLLWVSRLFPFAESQIPFNDIKLSSLGIYTNGARHGNVLGPSTLKLLLLFTDFAWFQTKTGTRFSHLIEFCNSTCRRSCSSSASLRLRWSSVSCLSISFRVPHVTWQFQFPRGNFHFFLEFIPKSATAVFINASSSFKSDSWASSICLRRDRRNSSSPACRLRAVWICDCLEASSSPISLFKKCQTFPLNLELFPDCSHQLNFRIPSGWNWKHFRQLEEQRITIWALSQQSRDLGL